MALDFNACAALIESYMPNSANLSDEAKAARLAGIKAFARGIIEHLETAGTVTVPSVGLSAPSGGGPVVGVASGTIS